MLTLTNIPTHAAAAALPSSVGDESEASRARARLFVTGILMVVFGGLLAMLAQRLGAALPASEGRWALTAWGMLAGVVYFAGLWPIKVHNFGVRSLAWVWFVGLAMRAIVLPTAPFLEDDFNRYLWDGAVVAHGVNPYEFAPADALPVYGGTAQAALPAGLLSAAADGVRSKINHPRLTTVYGPVALAAFAAAHALSPWSMIVWRCILLVFDGMTMLALLGLLRMLKKPVILAAWYWWNPILLREVISSGHMDVIALPLVIVVLLLAGRGALLPASIVLALAAAVKIWPIVLAPLAVRAAGARQKTMLAGAFVFISVSAVLWAPVFAARHGDSSGFRAYSLQWYNNDAVFAGTAWIIQRVLPFVELDAAHGPRIARFIVAGALLIVVAVQTRQLNDDPGDLVRRSLVVLAVMFLLIPAQFPWYFLWMLPLLAAAPRASLLAYTAFLPLYYAHYEHPWVVWIEHLPILAWFVWESWSSRSRAPVTTAAEREAMNV